MTLLGEAFLEWFADTSRWIDAVVKIAAAESDANRALLSRWFVDWRVLPDMLTQDHDTMEIFSVAS
jgi:hypothetical protein